MVVNQKARILRRSRSYAPTPIILKLETEGIFAAGAELVNCFCIGKMDQAILSQHIGDLKNLETLEFYQESVERFKKLFRFEPQLAVMDMHPDYLSSKFVSEMGIPYIAVQHHHAHIASCMVENGLDEKVIGISFDGSGLGDDGNIWGGEFFIADLENYERSTHFEYIQQPGGDASNHHPWRMMLSYLFHYFGENVALDFPFLFEKIEQNEIKLVLSMLKNKLNSPLTSSAGRLFDAVSALLGVIHHTSYHAEAPMRLEAIANAEMDEHYRFEIKEEICFQETFKEMITDIEAKIPISIIAGKFHQTFVEVILTVACQIRKKTTLNKVVLSGGTFQNRIILGKTEIALQNAGFEVYTQSNVPSNDGGIALGQLAIAAKRRKTGKIFE
jgi:hydrogenase maturation protein HypF